MWKCFQRYLLSQLTELLGAGEGWQYLAHSELLQMYVLFFKKITLCTVIFHNTAGTILAQSHTTLHSYVHLKQAMKSIVKKPVTNTTQIYSLLSKIQSKGEKAVLYCLNASSFILLFSC